MSDFCEQFKAKLEEYGVAARIWRKGERVYLDTQRHVKCWFSLDDCGLFVEDRGQPWAWVKSQKEQFGASRAYLIAAGLYGNMLADGAALDASLDSEQHDEPMHVLDDGELIVFITDVATVCGANTGADGAFLAAQQADGSYKLVTPV